MNRLASSAGRSASTLRQASAHAPLQWEAPLVAPATGVLAMTETTGTTRWSCRVSRQPE